MASQIINLTIVYSIVHSGADQNKHQSFASLAFVRGIHRWPVNTPHKWPVMRKMFPFDNVIMKYVECISMPVRFIGIIKWLIHQFVVVRIYTDYKKIPTVNPLI